MLKQMCQKQRYTSGSEPQDVTDHDDNCVPDKVDPEPHLSLKPQRLAAAKARTRDSE